MKKQGIPPSKPAVGIPCFWYNETEQMKESVNGKIMLFFCIGKIAHQSVNKLAVLWL